MPFIRIITSKKDITKAQITSLIERTTDLMSDVMHKKAERVSVLISVEDPELWAVGGKIMSDIDGCGVRMNIDVTTGTNSITEKEDMVEASNQMLFEVLGSNSEATYIVINEISGVSWGKGGIMLADRTKADRMAQRELDN